MTGEPFPAEERTYPPRVRPQLFPRLPRKMRQPSKDALREHLTLAVDEIMRLREQIDRLQQVGLSVFPVAERIEREARR